MPLPTIVVGIDGSPTSHAALRLGIDEAALRRGRVKIVVSWSARKRLLALRPDLRMRSDYDVAVAAAYAAVDAVSADHHERSLIVVECGAGSPGSDLVRTSRGADLLVIGATSGGRIARELRTTTVDHCLNHSTVPVVVVPVRTDPSRSGQVERHQGHGAPGTPQHRGGHRVQQVR